MPPVIFIIILLNNYVNLSNILSQFTFKLLLKCNDLMLSEMQIFYSSHDFIYDKSVIIISKWDIFLIF